MIRSATSRWNINTSRSYHGGHGSTREPVDQERGRDIVRQVRDDTRRPAGKPLARIEAERVACNHVEPSRIVRGNLIERRDGALVALDRDHASPLRQQGTRQPAGPGADLHRRHALERAGGAGDARGEIEIEQEILAERLSRAKPVPPDHLPQWRQVIEGAHARRTSGDAASAAESRAASLSAAIRLDGSARPVPAISKAVP